MRAAADFTEQEKSLSTPRGGSKKCQERSRGDTEIARLFLKTLDNGNMRGEEEQKKKNEERGFFRVHPVCLFLSDEPQIKSIGWTEGKIYRAE